MQVRVYLPAGFFTGFPQVPLRYLNLCYPLERGQRLGWCRGMRHSWMVRLIMGGPTDLLMMILKGSWPALSTLTSHEERVMKVEDRGTITSAGQRMWTVIRDFDIL